MQSKPLVPNSFSIKIDSAVTLEDGKTMIIELGHPNSSDKTIVMLLRADLITPTGHFLRDYIQPLDQQDQPRD